MHPLDDNNIADSIKPSVDPVATSQFGILDLILVMTGVAIALAISGWQNRSGSSSIPIYLAVHALGIAASISAFFLLIRRWLAGAKNQLLEPGCLYVLQVGIVLFLNYVSQAVIWLGGWNNFVVDSGSMSNEAILFLCVRITIDIASILLFSIAVYLSVPRWRVFFFGLIGSTALSIASWATLFFIDSAAFDSNRISVDICTRGLFGLTVIAGMVCLFMDRRQRIVRSWIHWIGIALFLFHSFLFPLLGSVLSYFLTYEQMYGG